jgi:hypothetical protein
MVQDFVHDDEGRMVRASGRSRNGSHDRRYEYDAIGSRTGEITSRIAASDIERFALHREAQHTQSARQCRTNYDPLGRTRERLSELRELRGPHGMTGAHLLGSSYETLPTMCGR